MGKPFFHLYFSSNFSQLVLECSLFVVYEAKKSDAITVLRMNENSDPNVISTAEKKLIALLRIYVRKSSTLLSILSVLLLNSFPPFTSQV